jgi:hypothetical protein
LQHISTCSKPDISLIPKIPISDIVIAIAGDDGKKRKKKKSSG